MYSCHAFRGSLGRGRGWRSYSDRPSCEYTPQFISCDSHFEQVQEVNRGFWPQYDRGNYQIFPPPSSYHYPPTLNHFYRPPQAPAPYFNQNQQFYRPQPHFIPQQQQLRPSTPEQLEYRNWEYAKPGLPPHCERFTIISYNILADYLVTDHRRELYFHIPQYILDWEHRKRSIVFELGLWSADILCFQEVDKFPDLKEQLELRGYSGIWKMRTGEPIDGCAIFWRNSRFKLLHEESLEFNKLGLRDNVAQICVFESLEQCKNDASASTTSLGHANKVVVCNIHVLFNPKRGEIKLGQIRVLLNRAHAVSKLWDDAPLIICGDFNCTPKSPLYNFIAEQKLDLSDLPRDNVSGQASATIHLPRPYNPSNSNFGAQCADNSAQHTKSYVSNPEEYSGCVVSCKSTSSDFLLDGEMERLSLNEELEGTKGSESRGENGSTFFTELHNSAERTMEKSKYDRSAWTPAEIEKATGTCDCTVIEHPLKLKSVYGEVQHHQGTRDSAGEPAVTSYHKRFLGTVDYIWRSEGLQTARVLAPIPKHAMLSTQGFPTKNWGSDHIALVSELAFS